MECLFYRKLVFNINKLFLICRFVDVIVVVYLKNNFEIRRCYN